MKKLNRNNTNFPLEVLEFIRGTKWESKYDFLKYYQNITREYVLKVATDSRGLIVMHGMGTGKSILAMSIAMDSLPRQPIVLLSKSLQSNMTKSIAKYIRLRGEFEPDYDLAKLAPEDLNKWIGEHFSFVSLNASNMLAQMGRATEGAKRQELDIYLEEKIGEMIRTINLDGKLLIVDEAHNFFRGIINGGRNALSLYNMILKARDLKILFLTGTPIANDPFELAAAFNMLASTPDKLLLPDNYADFGKKFVDEKNNKVKNREKFQNRIYGLVSYVGIKSKPGSGVGIQTSVREAEFPEELPLEVINAHMAYDQYTMYQLARDREKEEDTRGGKIVHADEMTKPRAKSSKSYRVHSRILSNYCPPHGYRDVKDPEDIPADKITSAKFELILKNILAREGQLGLVYSQFVGIGGLGSFARFLSARDWSEYTMRGGAYQSAIPSMHEYLGSDDEPEIPDAREAETPIPDAREAEISTPADTPADKPADTPADKPAPGSRFAIISGDIPFEIRQQIADVYAGDANKHGEIIRLLLISSTGAEGLDLKNVRHIHLMEPFWNWGRIEQVIARGVRNNSHVALPPSEKNVKPYLYIAVPPEGEAHDTPTTDEDLYAMAIANKHIIADFYAALKEVSIECVANGEKCRVCAPTGTALYTTDITRDINSRDPCMFSEVKKMVVREILIDGVKYAFAPNPESVFDYVIYEYDAAIGAHRRINERDPRFARILAEILTSMSASQPRD